MNLTSQHYLQFYSLINGIFFAVVVLLLLFALKSWRTGRHWRISLTYVMLSVGILCFGLYNIFFQQTHDAVTSGMYPLWLVKMGALAVPIALSILTYVFTQSVSLFSYSAAVAFKKISVYTNGLYALYALLFVTLLTVHDIDVASRLILITFIFPCMSGCYIAWKGLDNQHTSRVIGISFLFLMCGTIMMTWLTFDNRLMGMPTVLLGIHMSYAVLVVLICHAMLSMGRDELGDLFKRYSLDKRHIMNDIVPALTQGQFELHYQPQLSLASQRVSGIEALIRWKHPTKGNIPPTDFISIAEETGLIENITMWLIEEAVQHAKQLQSKGKPLELSINFSPKCFKMRLVNHLEKQLKKHAVPASLIIIEITENMMIREEEYEVKAAFAKLNDMGVQLSIDDFGTGFSSLSYLKKMSVRELKIDRSFVSDMQENKENYAIVYSTLQMTKSLDIIVVAEGVEDEGVLSQLTQMGCDKAQGYGIAKPMSFDDLEVYLHVNEVSEANAAQKKDVPERKHTSVPFIAS